MLSGSFDSVVSQASADTPKTTSPRITHGEVAAATASDPPCSDLCRAPSIPCLSNTWPTAADPTANSSSSTLAMVNLRLPMATTGSSVPPCTSSALCSSAAPCLSAAPCSSADAGGSDRAPVAPASSSALDNDRLLGVRSQPHDPLVAEERGAYPYHGAVQPAHAPQLPPVGLGD